jgi:chromosome segregation ATPase
MADEPSARELRRLEALEERLGKAQLERKDLVAERKELRAAVTANERRARAMENEAAAAATQLESVLAENRTLASRLDEISVDIEQLRSESLALKERADAATGRLKTAEESAVAAQRARAAVEKERDDLAKSLGVARAQLAGEKITQVIPAADVAKLVETLVADIGTHLSGLDVREGEMRLKVAFGKVGRESGFVLPTAESPPELRENLHELSLRFDRPLEQPPPSV